MHICKQKHAKACKSMQAVPLVNCTTRTQRHIDPISKGGREMAITRPPIFQLVQKTSNSFFKKSDFLLRFTLGVTSHGVPWGE